MRSRQEWLRVAVEHQRAGRWSAADAARAAAWAASGNEPTATRPEPGALEPGMVLRHMRWGKVEAECTFRGADAYEYAGTVYTTLAGATKAAATALGKKTTARPNALRFWGLDKQVQDDPRGFDQTRDEADLDENAEIEANEPEYTAAFADADAEIEE